jgi:hypothetical protein
MIRNRKAVIEMTIGLAVMAGAVQAQTLINTCPFVISSPGRYLLGSDLICGGGNGITITSSNVTLALEGHSITAGADANIAISAQGSSFTIRLEGVRIFGPGLITNGGGNAFATGVFFQFANDSEVSGVTVRGARGVGIGAATADFMTITANTLGRDGLGIELIDVHSSTISGNDASGNFDGMSATERVSGGPALGTVSYNIFNGNTVNGLGVAAFAGATIQHNVTNGNGTNGIAFGGVMTGIIELTNNTSLANGNFDLFTQPNCPGSMSSGNKFFTANQSCIH